MLKINNLLGCAGGFFGLLINGGKVNLEGLGVNEVDPNNRLSLTTDRVTGTAVPRNEDCYLSIPFINPVQPNEDCEILVDVRGTYIANNGVLYFGLSNLADDYLGIVSANKNFAGARLFGNSSGPTIQTGYVEADAGVEYQPTLTAMGNNLTRYFKIQIDRSTNTLYVKVASSSANRSSNTFLFTSSVALKSAVTYTHLIAISSRNDAFAISLTAYLENFTISKELT